MNANCKLGPLLYKRRCTARVQSGVHAGEFQEFCDSQKDLVKGWTKIVEDYEMGLSSVNPYSVPQTGALKIVIKREILPH